MVTKDIIKIIPLANQYTQAKSNPQNKQNNLFYWVGINLILIMFLVNILVGGYLGQAITWILNTLISTYAPQLLLFLMVIGIDIILVLLLQDRDITAGGLMALIIYFLLDWALLQTYFTQFSLLNFISN